MDSYLVFIKNVDLVVDLVYIKIEVNDDGKNKRP
jgi:hypothetical protein